MYPVVRRLLVVVSMLALILVGGLASPASAQTTQSHPVPNSMASMGDSITRAFNACGWYFDCTSRSFSTGSHSSVNSHYLRILDVNPAILGNNYNEARSGAKANAMASQASAVVNRDAEYVTILIGANDACTSSEDSMTPVDTFRAQIDDALDTLQAGLPDARVYVMSIPDIKRLWEVGHTSSTARFYWSAYNICQSMLANPTSFAEEDVQRRDRVQQRVIDYNTELADACAGYGANCTFDDNAVFGFPFELEHLSGWDYFHPNTEGQALLAQISYEAGFNW
jgi:lysophospholipase L1-like esterase